MLGAVAHRETTAVAASGKGLKHNETKNKDSFDISTEHSSFSNLEVPTEKFVGLRETHSEYMCS